MNFTKLQEGAIHTTYLYISSCYNHLTEPIAPFLEEYIKDLFLEEYTDVEYIARLKKNTSQISRMKRIRYNKFLSEMEDYQSHQLSSSKQQSYESFLNSLTLDTDELLQAAKEWRFSPDSDLLSCPFFSSLTFAQQTTFLDKDILQKIGEYIVEHMDSEQGVYEQVNRIIDDDLFSSGRFNTIQLSPEQVDLGDGRMSYPVTKAAGMRNTGQTELYVDAAFLDNLNEAVPDLHTQDFEILTEVLRFRDYRFAGSDTIEVPLKTLVELSYPGVAIKQRHYQEITNRLLKLAFYKKIDLEENGTLRTKGLLADVTIENRDGIFYVLCTVSTMIKNSFLNNDITSIYSDELPKLKGSFAYKLVFFIQKERILAYQGGFTDAVKIDYSKFLTTGRLMGRTKKEKIKEISTALDLIIETGIILKDYKISGSSFFLTFYDLTPQELKGYNATPLLQKEK